MNISSRTPEGEPASCPLCREAVVVEPSIVAGDAVCPRCGTLLWFVQLGTWRQAFEEQSSRRQRDRLLAEIASRLGISPEKVWNKPFQPHELGADSLDVAELVLELEEESGPHASP